MQPEVQYWTFDTFVQQFGTTQQINAPPTFNFVQNVMSSVGLIKI